MIVTWVDEALFRSLVVVAEVVVVVDAVSGGGGGSGGSGGKESIEVNHRTRCGMS